jgi:hypothetical protein
MRLTVLLAAALVGAGSMLLGVALADDGATRAPGLASTTTTLTAPTAADGPWWHDPHETLVGPAAVVLDTLTVDGDEALLTYRVEQITTASHGFVLESEDIPPSAPQDWELVTPSGVYPGSSTRASARQVRFPINDAFALEAVSAIRVTRHWLRIPYQYDVEIEASVGAAAPLDEGVVLSVDAVLEQAETALLHIDVTHPASAFGATDGADLWVLGSGPVWGPTHAKVGGGYSLTYFAPTLPRVVSLSIWASRWMPFDAVTDLDIGGLKRDG